MVGALVAIATFYLLRIFAAARDINRQSGESKMESVLLSSALQDAITKLKAQERAMAARADASERLSGQIVESLTSGLLVVDRDGRVQIANPAARRILHLEEQPASDYRTALSGAQELVALITESLRAQAVVARRTVEVATPRGPMHLGVTVSPFSGEGTAPGVICLFTDLTAVVALEEQLRLKEALARLGELTAGLAHEFRNGLATIHGYGRLLDPDLGPEQHRPYIEGIRDEAKALGEVVTNFLNFAKPQALTLFPVDLRTLIGRATEDVPSAKVTVEGEFGVVDADDVLLRQAISNLLRNSVDAVGDSGTVRIDIKGTLEDGRVQVEVADSGPGISPQALERVFQPFFTTRPNGTGLGLAIVQKVIVSHNGTISAGNRVEGGAIFRFHLPVSTSHQQTKP
jgi:two-component system sensor histidine kinase AtoS